MRPALVRSSAAARPALPGCPVRHPHCCLLVTAAGRQGSPLLLAMPAGSSQARWGRGQQPGGLQVQHKGKSGRMGHRAHTAARTSKEHGSGSHGSAGSTMQHHFNLPPSVFGSYSAIARQSASAAHQAPHHALAESGSTHTSAAGTHLGSGRRPAGRGIWPRWRSAGPVAC